MHSKKYLQDDGLRVCAGEKGRTERKEKGLKNDPFFFTGRVLCDAFLASFFDSIWFFSFVFVFCVNPVENLLRASSTEAFF